MHQAACSNSGSSHFKIARLLLEKGANVNAQDQDKSTPFYYLVSKARAEMVQLFLYFKTNIHFRNKYGMIPLWDALRDNNKKVVQLLLDLGSDVNSVSTQNGSTLLHEACEYGCSIEIVKKLLKKGRDVDARDYEGQTPLMELYWVTSDSFSATLTFLLKYADVNTVDSKGNNVLQFNYEELIWKIFLEHIAKMHRKIILKSVQKS